MDDTETNATLDLYAAGENFFLNLEKYVRKMHHKLERTVHYITFTTEKEAGKTGRASSRIMSLKEDEVACEWQDAVEWIKSNCRGKLVGRIEQDYDED